MVYELALTPQVFDKDFLEDSTNSSFRELVEILKSTSKNGLIISLNKDEWLRESMQRLNYLSPEIKDKIQAVFKRLKDRNLIVKVPKSPIKASSEDQWIEVATLSQNGIPFSVLVATQSFHDNILPPIDLIDSDLWEINNSQTIYIDQTHENMKKNLAVLLRYAQKVQIVDPYFNVSKAKYKKSLELISELFSSRRGNRVGRSIIIHCKHDEYITDDKQYIQRWKEAKDYIFKTYGHICTVNIWKENEKKMHDRFLITDQFGIQVGGGLDIREQNKTVWSLIDNNTKREVLNDYQENSSPFKLQLTL